MALNEKMAKRHLAVLNKKFSSKGLSRDVFITLLIFSVGMITLPLAAYYLFSYLSHGSTTIGAAAAIVTVHLILSGFVYKAIKEPSGSSEIKED